ncbi:c-type cytochrome [Sphingobium chlorophenolicum]|uniref:c-type cytochrome n=1 Tax=Sphingobium chlorophenolicum TaxID=46429 RepID=UPI0009D9B2E3
MVSRAIRLVTPGAAALLLSIAVPLPALAQNAPANGETVFRQRCSACHSAVVGQPNRVGPNLAGVVGRKPLRIQHSTIHRRSRHQVSPGHGPISNRDAV